MLTEGEWRWTTTGSGGGYIVCVKDQDPQSTLLPLTQDDADCMAASKEMLSALKGVTRILEAFKYTQTLAASQLFRLEAARLAIEKAEGR